MSTLADAFLADLDDLEEEENQETQQVTANEQVPTNEVKEEELGENESEDMESENEEEGETPIDAYIPGKVTHLEKDPQYHTYMENIKKLLETPVTDETTKLKMNIEDDPEYNIVLKTNTILTQISDEIMAIHHAVVEIYKTRFSELESAVPNPLDYLRVVARLKNEMDITTVKLDDILPPNQVMNVTMVGSIADGEPLSPSKLSEVMSLCDEALQLDQDRGLLLRFIQSRMERMAPNISALVGTHIAARIIGQVGGLRALSVMPSCNIMLVGQQKQVMEGMGMSNLRHTGIVFQSDIIQNCPNDLKKKACRVLANKLALAARIDASGVRSNTQGAAYRHDIQEKIAKWQEPSQGMRQRPLPVPGDAPKKKRGGRRMRKLKEQREMSDMRKLMNRRQFGVAAQNYADDAIGLEYGMLEARKGDIRRVVAKKMKMPQKVLKRLGQASSKGAVSGMASSFNLEDANGIELINKAKRTEAVDSKYFSAASGFSSVAPK
ncbi:hypothetical protein WA577_002924 [Blastocystis sp. JDR]